MLYFFKDLIFNGAALVSTGATEGLSACQGWSAGLVKSRPNLVGNNEFAMAA